jgi:TonB family protein
MMIGLGAYFLLAFAQASSPAQPTDVATPTDPKERIELGRKVNGLQGAELMPWHLKVSYEVFDADGKSKDKGTYEEWRISAKQFKLVFQSPAVALEEYGTDQGVFRTDGKEWPSRPLGMLQQAIVHPIPMFLNSDKEELKNFDRSLGNVKLQCTALLDRTSIRNPEIAPSYCFAPKDAVMLNSTSSSKVFQTLYEHISLVHGHYIAHDIQYFLLGKPWLNIHIDTLESLSPKTTPSLVVPAGLVPVDQRTIESVRVLPEGHLLSKVVPQYPAAAKAVGEEGTVLLAATIGKDGHVRELEVLAGPPQLRQPALDAVRQWVYSPYLLDGVPVEVEMEINVVYRLGG